MSWSAAQYLKFDEERTRAVGDPVARIPNPEVGTGAKPTRLAVVLETPEHDNEQVCGHLADAWNAGRDVEALAQVRVCVAPVFSPGLELDRHKTAPGQRPTDRLWRRIDFA